MGKLVFTCVLLLASFYAGHLSKSGYNLLIILWVFWFGWVFLGVGSEEKKEPAKKKRRIYFEDED